MTTELLLNSDFSVGQPNHPGGFTSNLTLPGWTQGGDGKVPIVPMEVVQGPYGGDAPHGIGPLNPNPGHPNHNYFLDTQGSPGPVDIQQTNIPTFQGAGTLTEVVALENVGGLTDNPANHLQFVFNGVVVRDISIADFTTGKSPIDYNHFLTFTENVTSVANDGSHNVLEIHEVGPGPGGLAISTNVGFAVHEITLFGTLFT